MCHHCEHLPVGELCTHCRVNTYFGDPRPSKSLFNGSLRRLLTPYKKSKSHYVNPNVIVISHNFKTMTNNSFNLIFFFVWYIQPESIYRPSWTELKCCLCRSVTSNVYIHTITYLWLSQKIYLICVNIFKIKAIIFARKANLAYWRCLMHNLTTFDETLSQASLKLDESRR